VIAASAGGLGERPRRAASAIGDRRSAIGGQAGGRRRSAVAGRQSAGGVGDRRRFAGMHRRMGGWHRGQDGGCVTSTLTIEGWRVTGRARNRRDSMPSPLASTSASPHASTSAAPGRGRLEGWTLTLAAAAGIAAVSAAIVIAGAASAGALGAALRFTARTSFALFLLAFTASSLHRLWPGRFTRWQLRNRRYLGVGFAASHLIHAAAILALSALDPAAFVERAGAGSRIPGLVAYALLLAIAATSFDRTAAWLGRRAWTWLHRIGGWYLWLVFAQAFLRRAPHAPAYWLPAALAIAALALRVVAWRGRARRR
jgi:DMSO/TMAO reductase YedYZ heme-binding membrane subunit